MFWNIVWKDSSKIYKYIIIVQFYNFIEFKLGK